jgi:uncharacterized OsmC-like protein
MNNINTENVNRFVSEIEKDATAAKKAKRVAGTWAFEEGKPQFAATVEYPTGSVVLQAELPPFAGWGTSPDPIQYCLYGMAACLAGTLALTAEREGEQLTKLEVTAECWMDLTKMLGLGENTILEKVKFTVRAEGASPARLDELVALTRERCAGVECMEQQVPLEVELAD